MRVFLHVMRALAVVALTSLMIASGVRAQHEREHAGKERTAAESVAVLAEPREAVVQVNGIVCSFCAYGAEKSLAQLDCLDKSKFGNGVLVDINSHQVTLALASGRDLPVREVYQRIKKAGYDPVTIYVRLSGVIERSGSAVLLRSSEGGQLFSLLGPGLEDLSDGEVVDIQAHLDPEGVAALEEDEPVVVVVDKRNAEAMERD